MAPRMVALLLVGLAVATVAPVSAEDAGESAGFRPDVKKVEKLMQETEKVWEAGERPDGSESVSKVEGALDHTIDTGMKSVEHNVEQKIEETALKGNEPHPAQFATDEAKQVVRGIKDSERLVGDDIAEFNKGYTKGVDYAKSQGGGMIPNYGAKVDEGMKQEQSQMKMAEGLKRAMETYVPKSALNLIQLEEATPSKEVIEAAKQDKEALSQPDLAAKYVAEVEHIPVEQVLGKKAAPKEAAAAAAAAPKKEQAAPATKASAPAEEPARTASGLPNAKHYIDEVMSKVQGDVDIQFAPVEEQLGYNLHQEVKLAQHQVAAVKEAAKTDAGIAQRQKDMRQANAIALAAKHAEAEAQKMKAAVNKAKAEHAANGEEDDMVSLIQMDESASPTELKQEIETKAVGIMKQNANLQDVLQKAMNDAEAKINTELNPILPTSMLPQNQQQANGILYHTMPIESAHASKEAALMKGLVNDPLERTDAKSDGHFKTKMSIDVSPAEFAAKKDSFKAEMAKKLHVAKSAVHVKQLPEVEELLEEGESPPVGYDPLHTQVSYDYKLLPTLIPNAASHVEANLNKNVGQDAVMEKLTEAAVEKVEAQDHADFQGLGAEHSYNQVQKVNKRMEKLDHEVVDARISAAEQVEEGRLPNGNQVQLNNGVITTVPH